jgi:hypothetical protein
MPNKGPAADALHLVGVRVPEDVQTVFVVAAAGYGVSLQDLLRPVLEREAERLLTVPQVRTMVRAAAELRATENGKLAALPSRRAPRNK